MNNYQKINSLILALSLSASGAVLAESFPPEHQNVNLELQAKQLVSNSGKRNTEHSSREITVPFHIYEHVDAARPARPVELNVKKTVMSDASATTSLHLFQHYN